MKVNVHTTQEPKRKSLFSGKEKEKAPKKGLSLGSKKEVSVSTEEEQVPECEVRDPELSSEIEHKTCSSAEDPSLSLGASEESSMGEVARQPVEEGQCTPTSDTPDEVEVTAPQTTTEDVGSDSENTATVEAEAVEEEPFEDIVYADKWSLSGGFALCTLATCVLLFTAGFALSDTVVKLATLLGVF